MLETKEKNSGKTQFASKLGFVMAAAGSAVGLGNIWSFPTFAASNGGGAFLFCYLLFVFLLGYPMLVAEITIGRHGQKDPSTALMKTTNNLILKKLAHFTGLSSVLVAFFILSFYAIIAGWFIAFAIEPFTTLLGLTDVSLWLTSFENSLSRDVVFSLIFLVLTFLIVQGGVEDGIEKWSKKLMPLLFGLLLALTVYLMFLPGATEGLHYYLVPEVEKIFDKKVLLEALGQSFFSLSLGAGVMMVYGAYLNDKESVPKLAVQVAALDTLVAFLAGLLILPAIFVAKEKGVEVFDAAGTLIDSDRLVFSVLPKLFQTMGGFSFLIAPLFYLLMTVAALTSSISMLEAPVSFLPNHTKLNRGQSIRLVTFATFLVSLVLIFNFSSLFNLVMKLVTQYAQPLTSLAVALFVGFVWKKTKLLKEIAAENENFEESFFWKTWPWYLMFVCPPLVLIVMVNSF